MRIVPLLISGIITIGLIVTLSMPIGSLPPLGSFVSPQHGFWQNAEPVDEDFSLDLNFPQLQDKVNVFFDERLVPHVFAQNDNDLYFTQGYLHARFRLWQMEFQIYVASGRIAEVLGAGPNGAFLNNDRLMRRVGMVHAAKRSLEKMESDPETKTIMDAYTAGINAYIQNLTIGQLPIEYRLLNYKPELWTNLKTALFLKYMSYDLTGAETDLENTNARSIFTAAEFEKLYPLQPDSLDPIVPKGTAFTQASNPVHAPASADSLYLLWKKTAGIIPAEKPDKDNGSNNWAVGGIKTASGRPILCNDPHLGLNLPSLWFEIQLNKPGSNAYGASFPGSPAVIIGFNDSCAWGVTNASRDVKDYYSIQFKDDSRREYWFNGEWKQAVQETDTFKVKGGLPVYDTIAYTIFGPVQYDASYTDTNRSRKPVSLAVRWKAHDPSNELKTFFLLNKANNYNEYLEAIKHFTCPGQNFVFASKSNDIAIWHQGQFPAKWKHQGDFVMPGTDSSYMWQDTIPQDQNPHVLNPFSGFVSSANQMPTDTTYPYYLGSGYDVFRGYAINKKLRSLQSITPADMQALQTSNYNSFAEIAVPVLLKNVNMDALTSDEEKYISILHNWTSFKSDAGEKAPAVLSTWFARLQEEVWSDEMAQVHAPYVVPDEVTLLDLLRKDSSGDAFIDNITTPEIETKQQVITAAFKKAIPELVKADHDGNLEWRKFKNTSIRHLLRLAPFNRSGLNIGGGEYIVNATKRYHGPSWRMVVHLTDKTEAYAVYPGGQSGNPGSRFYDMFIDNWAAGKYYRLWVMEASEANDSRVKWKMAFSGK